MKDKLILIVSIVLVVLGVIYLAYTSIRFFQRPNNNTNTNNQTTNKQLTLVGNSNKEILAENLNLGGNVKISIELENKTNDRISESLEGRVYKVKELNFFPSIDSDIPVDSKAVNATVNGNSKQNFEYSYSVSECGNFYMALADKEFWSKGRGKTVYGFFSVKCSGATPAVSPVASLNATINPTKSPLGGVKELPKSGPEDFMIALGVASVLSGLAVRLRVK